MEAPERSQKHTMAGLRNLNHFNSAVTGTLLRGMLRFQCSRNPHLRRGFLVDLMCRSGALSPCSHGLVRALSRHFRAFRHLPPVLRGSFLLTFRPSAPILPRGKHRSIPRNKVPVKSGRGFVTPPWCVFGSFPELPRANYGHRIRSWEAHLLAPF